MRATALGIHGGLPDESVFLPSAHEFQTVQIVVNLELPKAFNENSIKFRFMNVKRVWLWGILQIKVKLPAINHRFFNCRFGERNRKR